MRASTRTCGVGSHAGALGGGARPARCYLRVCLTQTINDVVTHPAAAHARKHCTHGCGAWRLLRQAGCPRMDAHRRREQWLNKSRLFLRQLGEFFLGFQHHCLYCALAAKGTAPITTGRRARRLGCRRGRVTTPLAALPANEASASMCMRCNTASTKAFCHSPRSDGECACYVHSLPLDACHHHVPSPIFLLLPPIPCFVLGVLE